MVTKNINTSNGTAFPIFQLMDSFFNRKRRYTTRELGTDVEVSIRLYSKSQKNFILAI